MKLALKLKGFVATLTSLVFIQSVSVVLATPAHASPALDGELADDTLLLLLAPHADRTKVESDLMTNAQATTIEDMHVNHDDYSILALQPPAGNREATLRQITSMMQQHPEYLSVTRNYLVEDAQSGPAPGASIPNDPDFTQQWPLANMHWPQAWGNYSAEQMQSTHITILTGGCDPVATNNELGAYITEYDTTKTDVKKEKLHTHSTEGDIDCSISSCLTDNSTLIAGAACFTKSMPCYVTLLRIVSNGSKNSSNRNIFRALNWAVNHQTERGGPGPVNLSYGGSASKSPFFNNAHIQKLAGSLLEQGDILVMAAGDKSFIQTQVTNTGNAVVVQASDKDNNFDTHHTLIQNDQAAAPGAAQPAIIDGAFNSHHDGSSFSAPLWSSAIAMVIAFNPSLTSSQANQIILSTGTTVGTVTGATWNAVIPNFRSAIRAAISMRPH